MSYRFPVKLKLIGAVMVCGLNTTIDKVLPSALALQANSLTEVPTWVRGAKAVNDKMKRVKDRKSVV